MYHSDDCAMWTKVILLMLSFLANKKMFEKNTFFTVKSKRVQKQIEFDVLSNIIKDGITRTILYEIWK